MNPKKILFICVFFKITNAIELNFDDFQRELKLRQNNFNKQILNYRMDGILLVNGKISGDKTLNINYPNKKVILLFSVFLKISLIFDTLNNFDIIKI